MTRSDGLVHHHGVDPRDVGLATYLRERAAALSLSEDVTDAPTTARAGLTLLDAALVAEAMLPADPRINALCEAGLFESVPVGTARFNETSAIRAAIQRPVIGPAQDGTAILALLCATGTVPHEPTDPAGHLTTQPTPPHPPRPLARLQAELARARTAAAVNRRSPQLVAGNATAAAARLLTCLEGYVAELLAHRLPVPPALRDELRLRRDLKPPD
jgi:hypothetical protein